MSEGAPLVRQLQAEIGRRTGRRYRIRFDALDEESLRELLRLLRNLEQEQDAAVSRARLLPWWYR